MVDVRDWEDNRQEEIKDLTTKGILPAFHDQQKAEKEGNPLPLTTTRYWLMGQGAGAVNDVKPAKEIINEIKTVDYVIPLNGLLYLEICEIIKPDYFVHGSDWKKGPQNKIRIKLINNINKWGGKVKEFKYTKNISSTILKENY